MLLPVLNKAGKDVSASCSCFHNTVGAVAGVAEELQYKHQACVVPVRSEFVRGAFANQK